MFTIFMVFGRLPRMPFDLSNELPNLAYVDKLTYRDDLVSTLQEAWSIAKKNIDKAQATYKNYYDLKVSDHVFDVNDVVFSWVPEVKKGHVKKLAKLWRGPFTIVQLEGNNAWVKPLNIPDSSSFRVHLNRLKSVKTDFSLFLPICRQRTNFKT